MSARFPFLFTLAVLALYAPAAEPVRYNRDVRPILSDNCFACHGPDAKERKAELRLDVREAALKPAESGEVAIVPGKVEASALVARILSTDRDEVMPPPKSHKKLSATQQDILRRWIAEGAGYEKHWAFEPVATVAVPPVAGAVNPIDAFVFARLAAEKLRPSPEAEAQTLVRRVTLDLTGLPPTPADVETFVAAAREGTTAAIHALLDRLFRSPRYGERMAVDWLDAARFADTQGYQVDRDQDMHAWRDWVIAAFNENMRFDRFTIEQLAGDLLPDATVAQKVATGFHRNHMVNVEGGIVPAEFIAEYTADRVETTAAVWLGQTFNCTRCHDHKFDPFTQRDFYSLKAFFANVGESGGGNQDTLLLPDAELEKRVGAAQAQLQQAQAQLAKSARETDPGAMQAWARRLVQTPLVWTPLDLVSAAGDEGQPSANLAGRNVSLERVARSRGPLRIAMQLPAGKTITALRLECASEADGSAVTIDGAKVTGGSRDRRKALPAVKLFGAVEGSSLPAPAAQKLLAAGRAGRTTFKPAPNQPPVAVVWDLPQPLRAEAAPVEIEVALTILTSTQPTEWRVLFTDASADQLVASATQDLAAKETAKLTVAERKKLTDAYLLNRPEAKAVKARVDELTEQIAALRKRQPTAIVMSEMERPKETFILMRGAYDKLGEPVTAATPAVLPALAAAAPRNRLGLAQWLVSAENPLTARVTVNRLWQSVFGTGLVRTSDDFGSQGEAPSHPELLDWLAGEFVRSGWDVQHLLRLILTSATYRQSSRTMPELVAREPENRLLARGPRFRLQAEFVRDQALAIAGLLSEKVGGPSVKPYHPPGLYELVTAGSSTNTWVEGKGEDLYRRSLYTYWKRSVPHPAMMAFDAATREVCTLRRPRSNTPLQALNLMNDPTYVEAARHLAQRMIAAGPDATARITHGFRLALARPPSSAELAVLTRALERAEGEFQSDTEAATALLKTGATKADETFPPATLAAFTSIASTILCLDETVTKE